MANEITLTLGLSVANAPSNSIPIPQGSTQFNQAGPGSGGIPLAVPIGVAPGPSFIASNYSTAPGMVWVQNISQNTAQVAMFLKDGITWVPLGALPAGQWASIPQYGLTGVEIGFAAIGAPGLVQCLVLDA